MTILIGIDHDVCYTGLAEALHSGKFEEIIDCSVVDVFMLML